MLYMIIKTLLIKCYNTIIFPLRQIKMLYYKCRLGSFGAKSRIYSPLHIDGKKNIYIGKDVVVQYKTWLAAVPLTGSSVCKLIVDDGCRIGHFCHIYSTKSIHIGSNCLLADKIYISDNLHSYNDISIPILKSGIIQKKEVEIGEGSWLGENVCVIGASIGKHCVVGANSVVTKDIPDFSVAVGAPAKVIKSFDFHLNEWVNK